jgi:hypothetical protein
MHVDFRKLREILDRYIPKAVSTLFGFLSIIFLVIALIVPYLGLQNFSDEDDNILGGMSVALGDQIYKDYYSQHTPIMYYLMAIPSLLNSDLLVEYRLAFFVIFALILASLKQVYKKEFGIGIFYLFSIAYVTSFVANPQWSYTIVSEHMQVLAYVGLFLEIIRSAIGKTISSVRWTLIGVYSILAVGVAFLSIYFVTAAILIILFFQLQHFPTIRSFRSFKPVLKWGIFASIPTALFLLFFVIAGNLGEMIDQAYTLNRTVYSEYLPSQFSSSGVFGPLLNTPNEYLNYAHYSFKELSDLGIMGVRNLSNILINVAFVFVSFRYKRSLGISVVIILLTLPVRGTVGFHALPYWGISALMFALLLMRFWARDTDEYLNNKEHVSIDLTYTHSNLLRTLRIALIFVLAMQYLGTFKLGSFSNDSFDRPIIEAVNISHEFSKRAIQETVNETVFQSSIDIHMYVDTGNTCDYKMCAMVPWFNDVYGDQIYEALNQEPPTIIFHKSDNDVWGYKVSEYAPWLDDFINENYVQLPIRARGYLPDFYENVYVSVEKFEEIDQKLRDRFSSYACFSIANDNNPTERVPIGEITSDSTIDFTFVQAGDSLDSVSIPIATFGRENTSNLVVNLYDSLGELLYKQVFDPQTLSVEGFAVINFPPIADSNGKNFTINITSENGVEGNAFTPWKSLNEYEETIDFMVDGVSQPGSLQFTSFTTNELRSEWSKTCDED